MTPEEAAEVIRRSRFRPGWTFRTAILDRTRIRVMAEIDTYDTSYRDRYGRLTRPGTIAPLDRAIIDVTELDIAGLLHAVITQLVRVIDDHEDREMFVLPRDGRWSAPLHPHTEDGMRAWERLELARAA